jgi:hypothetical protein
MKTYALALAFLTLSLCTFSFCAFAGGGPTAGLATGPTAGTVAGPATGPAAAASSKSRIPSYYVMMKHGRLIEVSKGHHNAVKKDITLTNETTIHPNGAIDAGSGQNLHLKEGQYITMDGRIRLLKNMPRK